MKGQATSVITLLIMMVYVARGQNISDVNALSDALMQGYNSNTRPRINQSDSLQVNLTLHFLRIRSFDEVEGRIDTVFWFVLQWRDELLSWNPHDHGNVSSITFPESSVWSPDFTILNSFETVGTTGSGKTGIVRYTNKGVAELTLIGGLSTICPLDTTYYPLDTQTCRIDFGLLGYPNGEVILIAKIDTDKYEKHGLWKLRHERSFVSCWFNSCNIGFTLERLSEFVAITLLVPIFTLVLLNPMVFLLPVESGERISFAITELLALTVFMTILDDYLPMTSDPITLLSYMLLILFGQSALILVLTIITLRMYNTADSQIPIPCLYILRMVRWLFDKQTRCVQNKVTSEEERKDHNNEYIEDIETPAAEKIKTVTNDTYNNRKETAICYKKLCVVFDIFCLCTMYIADIIIIVNSMSNIQNKN